MAAHGVNLGNYRDAEVGIGLGHGDGSSQSGPTSAYEKNIVMGDVHKPRASLAQVRLPKIAGERKSAHSATNQRCIATENSETKKITGSHNTSGWYAFQALNFLLSDSLPLCEEIQIIRPSGF